MNRDQFKSSLCHLCLCGDVLAPLPLIQEVAGSNTIFVWSIRVSIVVESGGLNILGEDGDEPLTVLS